MKTYIKIILTISIPLLIFTLIIFGLILLKNYNYEHCGEKNIRAIPVFNESLMAENYFSKPQIIGYSCCKSVFNMKLDTKTGFWEKESYDDCIYTPITNDVLSEDSE